MSSLYKVEVLSELPSTGCKGILYVIGSSNPRSLYYYNGSSFVGIGGGGDDKVDKENGLANNLTVGEDFNVVLDDIQSSSHHMSVRTTMRSVLDIDVDPTSVEDTSIILHGDIYFDTYSDTHGYNRVYMDIPLNLSDDFTHTGSGVSISHRYAWQQALGMAGNTRSFNAAEGFTFWYREGTSPDPDVMNVFIPNFWLAEIPHNQSDITVDFRVTTNSPICFWYGYDGTDSGLIMPTLTPIEASVRSTGTLLVFEALQGMSSMTSEHGVIFFQMDIERVDT